MNSNENKELTSLQEVYQYLDALNIDMAEIIEPVESSIQDILVTAELNEFEEQGNDTAHFRFASFGEIDESTIEIHKATNESLDVEKILDSYENIIFEQKELEYKVKEAKLAHIEEAEE